MTLVTTLRMCIFPISDAEIRTKIEQEPDAEMKLAYSEMLDGCLKAPEQRIWCTIWLLRLNDGSNQILGDLCFKGLNEDGSVEIGYGIKPAFEGKGFMTEAVTAMAKWASEQPGVSRVEAETDPGNAASQKVLQKAGFVPNGVIGEEGPRFVLANG